MEKKVIRIRTVTEADKEEDLRDYSPAELIGMMWQLTINAWSFRIRLDAEPRLQRDVVVLVRGER